MFVIVDCALRAVIDFFEICTINSLLKKNSKLSHCVQSFIGQHNQNKIIIIIIIIIKGST